MKPGSVIVDLAVEQGGNCPLSKLGEIVEVHGVKIVGHDNVPGRLAGDASSLYARNLVNFLTAFTADGVLTLDWGDEIVKGICLTHDGAVVHPNFAAAPAPEPAAAPDPSPARAAEGDAAPPPSNNDA